MREGIAVQSIGFRRYLPVGRPEIAAAAFNAWGADEILLVDISASRGGTLISQKLVECVANECSVPLTIGGGIKTVDEIGSLLDAGADKILVNSANLDSNGCLERGQKIYGRQCMVAGIDYVFDNHDFYVYDHRSGKRTNTNLSDAVKSYIDRGAGELFVNDVYRDGRKTGYDLKAIGLVSPISSIPVVWCGGAGSPKDFVDGFRSGNISALAAGNFFNFNEHSINITKSFVGQVLPLRQDALANYDDMPLDDIGRVSKLDENVLQNLLYEKLDVEVI